jgi:hypothetical protein
MSFFRFWKPDVRRDIDDELRFHFDARIAELVAFGATPEAAAPAWRNSVTSRRCARPSRH